MRKFYSPNPWREIIEDTIQDGSMVFSKEFDDGSLIPSPESSGIFRKSVGTPRGQKMDWRAGISGTDKCVHILEFHDRYESHTDNFDPGIKPFQHLFFDLAPIVALQFAGSGMRVVSSALTRMAGLLFD